MKTSNCDARQHVQAKRVFKGSNMWGEWYEQGIPETGEIIRRYVVYSYRYTWPLFVYEPATDTWYGNRDKVSRTTSRHFSQAHPLCSMTMLTLPEIKEVVRHGSPGLITSSNNLIGAEV
jgi:hypothetical protein